MRVRPESLAAAVGLFLMSALTLWKVPGILHPHRTDNNDRVGSQISFHDMLPTTMVAKLNVQQILQNAAHPSGAKDHKKSSHAPRRASVSLIGAPPLVTSTSSSLSLWGATINPSSPTAGVHHYQVGNWTNTHNVVHIVQTRFMLHQPYQQHLGTARLDLFRTFTLPSIQQQTNTDFLWIIWTEPKLNKHVYGALLRSLHKELPQPAHWIVLGGEPTKDTNLRDLFGYASLEDLEDRYLAGNMTLLKDAYRASQTRLLLETQLDADDAFSQNFIESVQWQAVATLGQQMNPQHEQHIEVYCPERHLEWRYFHPHMDLNNNNHNHDESSSTTGHLVQYYNPHFCINSGLSVAYHVQARALQLKDVAQCSVQNYVKDCDPEPDYHNRHRRIIPCSKKGIDTVTFHEEGDMDQMETCPTGSFKCEPAGSTFLGGPTFVIPSQDISCQIVKEEDDTTPGDVVDLVVTPTEYTPGSPYQTEVEIDVLSEDYMLAAVLVKSSEGGNHYSWQQQKLDDNTGSTVGGVKYGTFSTPTNVRPIQHVDICVIPTHELCEASSIEAARKFARQMQAEDAFPSLAASSLLSGNADVAQEGEERQECKRTIRLLQENSVAHTRNYLPAAVLQARTPTASGMKHVMPKKGTANNTTMSTVGLNSMREETFESHAGQKHAWYILEHDFGVVVDRVMGMRNRMERNMEDILQDALDGQCQHRFSCKDSTKRALNSLLERTRERKLQQNQQKQPPPEKKR